MSFPNLKENIILKMQKKIKIGDNWEGRLGVVFSRGSPGSGTRAGKCYLDDDDGSENLVRAGTQCIYLAVVGRASETTTTTTTTAAHSASSGGVFQDGGVLAAPALLRGPPAAPVPPTPPPNRPLPSGDEPERE